MGKARAINGNESRMGTFDADTFQSGGVVTSEYMRRAWRVLDPGTETDSHQLREVGFDIIDAGIAGRPDKRRFIFPTAIYRAWPGLQKNNRLPFPGVLLGPEFSDEFTSTLLKTARANRPPAQRFGITALAVGPGPSSTQVDSLYSATYGGVPVKGGGPGTVLPGITSGLFGP